MISTVILDDDIRVDLAECRLDSDADVTLEHAYTLLDETERGRAAAFRFRADRERFVRAHGFLRQTLGARLGLNPAAVVVVGGEGEKPSLADGRGVDFSLSHSRDHAVLAISTGAKVGVDLELPDAALSGELESLARFCLLDEERTALADLVEGERVPRFLSYWTAKEARMKLTGQGASLEPMAIALSLRSGRAVGYRRPGAPSAILRFLPLMRRDAVCCLALSSDRRAGTC